MFYLNKFQRFYFTSILIYRVSNANSLLLKWFEPVMEVLQASFVLYCTC